MAMVGQPLEEAFVAAFPDLSEAQRQVLLERDGDHLGQIRRPRALDEILKNSPVVVRKAPDGHLHGRRGFLALPRLVIEEPFGLAGRWHGLQAMRVKKLWELVVDRLDGSQDHVLVGLCPTGRVGPSPITQRDRQGDDKPTVTATVGRARRRHFSW